MGKRADQARGVWCCQGKTLSHLAGRLRSRFRGAASLATGVAGHGVSGHGSRWPRESVAGVDEHAIMTVSPARSWLMAA